MKSPLTIDTTRYGFEMFPIKPVGNNNKNSANSNNNRNSGISNNIRNSIVSNNNNSAISVNNRNRATSVCNQNRRNYISHNNKRMSASVNFLIPSGSYMDLIAAPKNDPVKSPVKVPVKLPRRSIDSSINSINKVPVKTRHSIDSSTASVNEGFPVPVKRSANLVEEIVPVKRSSIEEHVYAVIKKLVTNLVVQINYKLG